jgi:hypothetical protein
MTAEFDETVLDVAPVVVTPPALYFKTTAGGPPQTAIGGWPEGALRPEPAINLDNRINPALVAQAP